MSKRLHLAALPLLLGLSASALAQAPETVNIGYQKANIFALLKYRGTLDETLKNRASPCAGWNSRPARRCWKG
jgi:sulfonate transport system substrate-binding protein